MPHSKLAPVILGTVLAASLAPTHASATDGQPADTVALTTAQAGGESVEALQNTAADHRGGGRRKRDRNQYQHWHRRRRPQPTARAQTKGTKPRPLPMQVPPRTPRRTPRAETPRARSHPSTPAVAAASATAHRKRPRGHRSRRRAADLRRPRRRRRGGTGRRRHRARARPGARPAARHPRATSTSPCAPRPRWPSPRGSSFPLSGGKPLGMILLNDGASLTLEGTGNGTLTLSGENKDSKL